MRILCLPIQKIVFQWKLKWLIVAAATHKQTFCWNNNIFFDLFFPLHITWIVCVCVLYSVAQWHCALYTYSLDPCHKFVMQHSPSTAWCDTHYVTFCSNYLVFAMYSIVRICTRTSARICYVSLLLLLFQRSIQIYVQADEPPYEHPNCAIWAPAIAIRKILWIREYFIWINYCIDECKKHSNLHRDLLTSIFQSNAMKIIMLSADTINIISNELMHTRLNCCTGEWRRRHVPLHWIQFVSWKCRLPCDLCM